jgi:Uncharacterized protein conserved in archaea
MTIFKEKLDEEYLTIAETKEILEEMEVERAADEDREMRYELARAIEHVNRFAELTPEQSRELVAELTDLEKVDERLPTRSPTSARWTGTNSARCTHSSGTPCP